MTDPTQLAMMVWTAIVAVAGYLAILIGSRFRRAGTAYFIVMLLLVLASNVLYIIVSIGVRILML